MIFTLPIVGGYLADYFGYHETTIAGIGLCIFGIFMLGGHHASLLKWALATFSVGLAVCATTSYCILDFCYGKQDHRRESGFTLFYLMFNIGFLIAGFSGGYLVKILNYAPTFQICTVVLLLGLILFLLSIPKIKAAPGRCFQGQFGLHAIFNFLIAISALCLLSLVCIFLLNHLYLANALMFVLIAMSIIGIIFFAQKKIIKLIAYRYLLFYYYACSLLVFGHSIC